MEENLLALRIALCYNSCMKQLKQKFITQRTGARNRGIEWHFTFEKWLAWWGDDIHNRGNRSGQLVMARIGDTGPYHPVNVRKITCNENHSEAHKNGLGWSNGWKHTEETRAKISANGKGRVFTPEHRANMNQWSKGIARSEEVKSKIRISLELTRAIKAGLACLIDANN